MSGCLELFGIAGLGAEAPQAAAAAFSPSLIFSFSLVNVLGNEKKGMATNINNKPQSKNPPHHIPTQRWSAGSKIWLRLIKNYLLIQH